MGFGADYGGPNNTTAFDGMISIMATDCSRFVRPRRIAGASAIEFAFVFPILFMILYGTVVYGYVFFLQQRINFAAQEAVRAAVAIAPVANAGAYNGAVQSAAINAVNQNFVGPGGGLLPAALTVSFPAPAIPNTLNVQLNYSLINPTLFPVVTFPLIGPVPPLPNELVARAVGRLS